MQAGSESNEGLGRNLGFDGVMFRRNGKNADFEILDDACALRTCVDERSRKDEVDRPMTVKRD